MILETLDKSEMFGGTEIADHREREHDEAVDSTLYLIA